MGNLAHVSEMKYLYACWRSSSPGRYELRPGFL